MEKDFLIRTQNLETKKEKFMDKRDSMRSKKEQEYSSQTNHRLGKKYLQPLLPIVISLN